MLKKTALIAVTATTVTATPLIAATAAHAADEIKAPGMLKVTRDNGNMQNLHITWKPVQGADHYIVRIFNGTKDTVKTVPGDTTSLNILSEGTCNIHNVKVTAVDAAGNTATTNTYQLAPLAPKSVQNLTLQRSADGETGTLQWNAPQTNSSENPNNVAYQIKLKQLNTGNIIADYNTSNLSTVFENLNPNRMYAGKITAYNNYGSCVTSTALFRNETPSEPTKLVAVRDATTPSQVNLTWNAPQWQGYGNPDHYTIAYRATNNRNTEYITVPYGTNHTSIVLPSNQEWNFQVRVVSDKKSKWTSATVLKKDGAVGTIELDPSVAINTTNNGVVTVTFSQPVGSSKKYPQMKLDIAPTVGKGFSDSHTVSNAAGTVEFDKVPCGVYTVTVTGVNPATNDMKEFGRSIVNQCNTGAVPANMWKLVHGKADISGNFVDMRYGNESRVMSTLKRNSKNAVFTTEATLKSGWGYGIWTRASLSNGNKVSGYSFQYDPGYANVNPGFGKALLLRVWDNGNECGNPVAKVKWPQGLNVNDKHKIVVVNEGDKLYASIDGIKMFDVPSLKQALQTSGCSANFKEPSGTEVGFRSWNASSSVMFENTTLN